LVVEEDLMPAPILSQPRNFAVQLTPGAVVPGMPKVGVIPPAVTALTRLPAETVVVSFSIVRFRTPQGACSVGWRVVLTNGETGVFEDDVLPEGRAEFVHLETQEPAAFAILAGAPPVTAIHGTVDLFDPLACEIDPLRDRFTFVIAAAEVEVGDAIVGLSVSFSEITRGGGVSNVVTNSAGVSVKNAAGVEVRAA
jgi:hypothetical protein